MKVCVEVGMPGGRTGCRSNAEVDEVARAAAACPQLSLDVRPPEDASQMDPIHLIRDKAELAGTCYFELLPGEY